AVPRGVQRLDPAARAEVERAPARGADRDLRERERGTTHPEHVVGAQRTPGRELAEVRGDPPLELARRVARGVGPQVEHGVHAAGSLLDEPESCRPVGAEARQRGVEQPAARGTAEEEGTHEGRKAVPLTTGGTTPLVPP